MKRDAYTHNWIMYMEHRVCTYVIYNKHGIHTYMCVPLGKGDFKHSSYTVQTVFYVKIMLAAVF